MKCKDGGKLKTVEGTRGLYTCPITNTMSSFNGDQHFILMHKGWDRGNQKTWKAWECWNEVNW